MLCKTLPPGICDHCGQPFPPGLSWETRRGPRRYCSRQCRNTANSRAGNPVRSAKLRQAVAAGRWQNPHLLKPPTAAEQARRARLGRLREVAVGRWRNPALADAARARLSRPRVNINDPVLHAAHHKLRVGHMTDLTVEERAAYLAYRQRQRAALRRRKTAPPDD